MTCEDKNKFYQFFRLLLVVIYYRIILRIDKEKLVFPSIDILFNKYILIL